MNRDIYRQILEKSMQPHAREKTIGYLQEHLRHYFFPGEKVLICFLSDGEESLSNLMAQAVTRCGSVPVVWGPDHRWMTLLRLAFTQRVTAIIGPPLVILGLAKLRKYKETPLSIRKVVTAGYPCLDWMVDGIIQGMDCEAGGCFSLGESGVVAGFACGHDWGVHLRSDEYGVDIMDAYGEPAEPGELGEMVIYPKSAPHLRFFMGERGRISTQPCPCGCKDPHLKDMRPGAILQEDLVKLGVHLQKWTSILDCRLKRGSYGLEMEIVYFQGEKLPKLPTAAKMILRPWSPERDEPFPLDRPLQW